MPKKIKTLTLSKAKKKAWDSFSKWVRQNGSIAGFNECVTCGRKKPWKELHAGHFIPGRHNSVLFDERNVHPQCYACNVVLGGNGPKYQRYMKSKYGQKVIDELEELDRQNRPMKVYEFLELADRYGKVGDDTVSPNS